MPANINIIPLDIRLSQTINTLIILTQYKATRSIGVCPKLRRVNGKLSQ